MDNIKVSIIIPVYNQPDLVIKALNSIPKRDDIEIIIIDDNSTDNTLIKIEHWINKNIDRHIKLIICTKNKGCATSLNKGLNETSGKYILQLDSDDELFTEEFNKLLDKEYSEDLIWFSLQVNNGSIWNIETQNWLCDHSCLYKKSIIGDTRFPELRSRAGWFFHKDIMNKKPTQLNTKLLVYKYNFPREGSILWNDKEK